MMGFGWQDVIVVAGVVAALAYLVRRRRRRAAPPTSELVGLGRAPKRNGGGGARG
jgi:hypothetical protein